MRVRSCEPLTPTVELLDRGRVGVGGDIGVEVRITRRPAELVVFRVVAEVELVTEDLDRLPQPLVERPCRRVRGQGAQLAVDVPHEAAGIVVHEALQPSGPRRRQHLEPGDHVESLCSRL